MFPIQHTLYMYCYNNDYNLYNVSSTLRSLFNIPIYNYNNEVSTILFWKIGQGHTRSKGCRNMHVVKVKGHDPRTYHIFHDLNDIATRGNLTK